VTICAETRAIDDAYDEVMAQAKVISEGSIDIDGASVKIHVNGEPAEIRSSGPVYQARKTVASAEHKAIHSVWRPPYGSIVTAVVRLADGRSAGAFAVTGGIM
jgi:amidase